MRAGRSRALRLAGWVALAWLSCTIAGAASSHTRSMSYSTWQLDEQGADVTLRIKLLELTRRPPEHVWTASLPADLLMLADDTPCTASGAQRGARSPVGWAHFRWRVDCVGGARRMHSELLSDVAVAHTHFARVLRSRGAASDTPLEERVLITGRDADWPLDAAPDREAEGGTSLSGYIGLGLRHILEGYDHLAFVFALLLLSVTVREVVTLVTSFTLAHSITLGLAVAGAIRPETTAVEVLIGFSIALVALENGWLLAGRDPRIPRALTACLVVAAGLGFASNGALGGTVWLGLALFSYCHISLLETTARPARLRGAVAFGFGLIHGLGFAGVLMEVELPAERLVQALFGFNFGVELGQLAVVALVWPLLRLAQRVGEGRPHRLIAEAGSAAVLALGLYWTIARNWG